MDGDVNYAEPWYHGSPLRLEVLRAGSTVTQWRDLARVFSHKPAIVTISDDRATVDGRATVNSRAKADSRVIQHNGTRPGYLYEIAEAVRPEDVTPHPRTTMAPNDEWLTTRELRLRLIEKTVVRAEEFLPEEAAAALREQVARRHNDTISTA